jgi:hypothetical protein
MFTDTHMASTTSASMGGRRLAGDPSLRDIILVDQLPSGAWAEGIIVRLSGAVLTTRIDTGELYSIIPTDTGLNAKAVLKTIHTFPTECVINICHLASDDREEYAVMTAHIDFDTQEYHSTAVWRLSFTSSDSGKPTLSKIANLPEAVFCLGMEQVADDVVLVIDMAKFCIWQVRLSSGDVTMLFSDDATMRPKSSEDMFGANCVRFAGGYLYYTNMSTGALHRVAAEVRGPDSVEMTGGVETVVPTGNIDFADGLVMTREGRTAYVTNSVDGLLQRIDVDTNQGTGIVTTLIDELISPSALDLVYRDVEDGKPTLYVVCCGPMMQSPMRAFADAGFDYAGVDERRTKIEIIITTEVVVTYETVELF